MRDRIDIVVPGLFDLPLGEFDPALVAEGLPGLNRLLRLATAVPNDAYSLDAILRRVLRLDGHGGASLPLAQACAETGVEQAERLLLSRGVHLRADLQHAVLVPIERSDRDRADENLLISDLAKIFDVDCEISTVAEGLFLVRLKNLAAPTHYPHLLSVLGKSVNPFIEQSRENLTWYRLVNEMQMFLHQHEVNRERSERGLPTINSLWFWGGGAAPAADAVSLAWYCDDALLNRFAASRGLQPAALERLGEAPPSAAAAIVDLRLLEILKSGARGELEAVLRDIDRRLLKPLLAAPRGRRSALRLRAGYEFDFLLPAAADWKFWRRPRSLADWAAAERD